MLRKMLGMWPEICKEEVSLPWLQTPFPQGVEGWWLAYRTGNREPEGTPSPKICLKLPLMFLALAMTFRELKYA